MIYALAKMKWFTSFDILSMHCRKLTGKALLNLFNAEFKKNGWKFKLKNAEKLKKTCLSAISSRIMSVILSKIHLSDQNAHELISGAKLLSFRTDAFKGLTGRGEG